jgi:imidazolonepropionase
VALNAPWRLEGVRLATMCPGCGDGPLGVVEDGAVVVGADGRLVAVGARGALRSHPVAEVWDGRGGWLLPGFVDAHTHLVYAGDRSDEHATRWAGGSYEAIARAGGGIASTVRATAAASDADLLRMAVRRARALRDDGVTTVEVKSGYGLSTAAELRLLRVIARVGPRAGVRVVPTLLAAHAVPAGFTASTWVDEVITQLLPQVWAAGLARRVDAFCASIAFDVDAVDRLLGAAAGWGYDLTLHADQLANEQASALLARWGGRSADHVEHLDAAGVAALAEAGAVAVLLPGAAETLREPVAPPVAALRAAGVGMAVATDHNPGTSPFLSMRWMLHLACTRWGLTPEEALLGATRWGAVALGVDAGRLVAGAPADLALWATPHPRALVVAPDAPDLVGTWVGGAPRWHGAPRPRRIG